MKKYLVPVDGSINSEIALKTAVDLAEKTGASITLISILDSDTFLTNNHIGVSTSEIIEQNTENIGVLLDNLIDTYNDKNIKFEKKITTGNIANEILAESEEGYEMIIIGSRGLTTLKRTFLGSVSNKVVNSSRISTLVVKAYYNNDFSHILVPVDGSTNSKRAAYIASDLGKLYDSELTLLNVITQLQVPDVRGVDFGVVQDYYPISTKNSENLLNEYAKSIEDYPNKMILQTKIGNVADAILETADEQEDNLIIIGSKGKGAISRAFMGSVSNAVIHHTKRSVLVIK
ncbi:MAG: universal stress protein [Tissierellia bacterium]|nr:universal stress protein [Tissierellia bacterium]